MKLEGWINKFGFAKTIFSDPMTYFITSAVIANVLNCISVYIALSRPTPDSSNKSELLFWDIFAIPLGVCAPLLAIPQILVASNLRQYQEALNKELKELNQRVLDKAMELEDAVVQRDEAIEKQDKTIVELRTDVTQRDLAIRVDIDQRDKIIEEKNGMIDGLKAEIAQKDETISELETTVTQKDEIMQQQGTTIAGLKVDIAKKDETITERDATIVDLRTDVIQRNETITELRADVDKKKKAVAELIAQEWKDRGAKPLTSAAVQLRAST